MADRIKLRRGPKNKMDLNVYELGYATDSTEKRLYFNDGSMVPIPNEKDITDIKAEVTNITSQFNTKMSLFIGENIPDISNRDSKTLYFKVTETVNTVDTSETIKASHNMGIKVVE